MGRGYTVGCGADYSKIDITEDNFRDVIKYKGIASLIVKFVIPEYKSMTLTEISKLIVNSQNRVCDSGGNILEQEIEQVYRRGETGKSLSDLVFNIRGTNGLINTVQIGIKHSNTELGNSNGVNTHNSDINFGVVSEAINCGAELLSEALYLRSEFKIHKVYNICLCSNSIGLSEFKEIKGQHIHRYGVRRFYSGIPKVVSAEEESDLMEVILVEVNKIRRGMGIIEDMIYMLFNDAATFVGLMESLERVKLTRLQKCILNTVYYEGRIRRELNNAKEKFLDEAKTDLVAQMVRSGVIDIKEGAKLLNISAVDFEKIMRIVSA